MSRKRQCGYITLIFCGWKSQVSVYMVWILDTIWCESKVSVDIV